VVARAAPTNFLKFKSNAFVGMPVPVGDGSLQKNSIEYKTNFEASPVSYVSPDDPPFLLMHGDKDESVPFAQSEDFEEALKEAGVTVKLLRVKGAGHGPSFPGAINPPDYLGEMTAWFNRYLMSQ
jgi:dipeptidyl aminopeptidase/acylaminoacyl peptidase